MSRSINSDKSWNSTDEECEDCDHSMTANSSSRRISGDDIPGACITSHSVGSVIRPGCKLPRIDPLQFVKIHNNDLCKKAVEQIKLAEEVKITKEKIKEVEEEWQNNLLSWKSKRRQSKNSGDDESSSSLTSNRKTKTFSEILNEKAKSGQRIGYNLHKYIDGELENDNEIRFNFDNSCEIEDKTSDEDMNVENERLDRHKNNNNIFNSNNNNEKHNLGDVIVFDTSLLQEFSYNHKRDESSDDSSVADITNKCQNINKTNNSVENNCNNSCFVEQNDELVYDKNDYKINQQMVNKSENIVDNKPEIRPDRVRVEIKDWKQQNSQQQRDNVLMYLLKQEQHQQLNQNQQRVDEDLSHHNSSYDAEDDEEDDEELERIRLEQEKSFRAKLSAFESLSKQEEYNNQNNRTNSNRSLARDESNRQLPAREDVVHNESQHMRERPVVYDTKFADEEDSEEVMNARIQQLHIERQRAQRPSNHINGQQQQQHIQTQPQPQAPNVIYQSYNYNQNPVQQSAQSGQQRQHYYLMDESIGKQNPTPVRSPQPIRPQPTPVQPLQSVPLPNKQPIQPQEHLYVNQKQLFSNQTPNPNQLYESHKRYGSEYYDSSYDSTQALPQTTQLSQPIPETSGQQPQHNQMVPIEQNHPNHTSPQNQYLYYPKPYTNKASKPVPIQKPIAVSQQHKPNPRAPQHSVAKQAKPHQSGYNQNHWLLQEAELRRQLASIPAQTSIPNTVSATQRTTTTASVHKSSPTTPQKGMLSVSGKKKCSSCADELGRGCAAMVVESLSLYYHINCFRCSVCNIQLGNGTVGTDVRVRNHKLHCQNCYSNDEAGLKFSRV